MAGGERQEQRLGLFGKALESAMLIKRNGRLVFRINDESEHFGIAFENTQRRRAVRRQALSRDGGFANRQRNDAMGTLADILA